MDDLNFKKLVKSVKQAGQIRRGTLKGKTEALFTPDEIRAIRESLDVSQTEFATLIGVSVGTLRNWEQGRRQPEGPARALLCVVAQEPEAVARALCR